jgi:hypothetical protein
MEMKIRSKKFNVELTFSRPGGGYIFCDMGMPWLSGSLGLQLCKGGGPYGLCLSYQGDDEKVFQQICRKWWRDYLKNARNHPIPVC